MEHNIQKHTLARRIKQLQALTIIVLLLMAGVGIYQTILNLSINVSWAHSQTLISYNENINPLAIDFAESDYTTGE